MYEVYQVEVYKFHLVISLQLLKVEILSRLSFLITFYILLIIIHIPTIIHLFIKLIFL